MFLRVLSPNFWSIPALFEVHISRCLHRLSLPAATSSASQSLAMCNACIGIVRFFYCLFVCGSKLLLQLIQLFTFLTATVHLCRKSSFVMVSSLRPLLSLVLRFLWMFSTFISLYLHGPGMQSLQWLVQCAHSMLAMDFLL